jgi:Ca2+-binding EF-hand superfamily protein
MRVQSGGGIGMAKAQTLGRQVFAKVDENRDGVLTAREVRTSAVATRMGLLGPGESQKQWMERLDRNRDGVLSRHEAEGAFAAAAFGSAVAAIAAMVMTEGMAAFPDQQDSPTPDEAAPDKHAPRDPDAQTTDRAQRLYARMEAIALDRAAETRITTA